MNIKNVKITPTSTSTRTHLTRSSSWQCAFAGFLLTFGERNGEEAGRGETRLLLLVAISARACDDDNGGGGGGKCREDVLTCHFFRASKFLHTFAFTFCRGRERSAFNFVRGWRLKIFFQFSKKNNIAHLEGVCVCVRWA